MPYKDKIKRYEAIRRSVAKKPELYKALNRKNQKTNVRLNYFLKRSYGITLKDYNELVALQCNLCAICGKPPSGQGKSTRLHVDHCHKSGKVRGLLCGPCNRRLGIVENEDWLNKAEAYLEENS